MSTGEKKAPLRSNQLHVDRHAFTSFCVQPSIGTKLCDVTDIDFFQHVSGKLRSGDTIYVAPEGLMYWAQLLVVSVSGKEVKTQVITQVDLSGDVETSQVDEYVVCHGGPHHKWRVMKGKEVISKGHDTKEAAEQVRDEHLESMAR